jgi:hypothetical protein
VNRGIPTLNPNSVTIARLNSEADFSSIWLFNVFNASPNLWNKKISYGAIVFHEKQKAEKFLFSKTDIERLLLIIWRHCVTL